MRLRTVLCAAVAAALVAGCAKSWPDEIPDPEGWQMRSVKALPWTGQPSGAEWPDTVVLIAYVYASNRSAVVDLASKPIHGVNAPTRLDVMCRDDNGDGKGAMTIRLVPDQVTLQRQHPSTWDAAHMEFSGGELSAVDVPLDLSAVGLSQGVSPRVGGEHTPAAVRHIRELVKADAIDGEISVYVDLPGEDSGNLIFEFPLGLDANTGVLRRLYDNCGEEW